MIKKKGPVELLKVMARVNPWREASLCRKPRSPGSELDTAQNCCVTSGKPPPSLNLSLYHEQMSWLKILGFQASEEQEANLSPQQVSEGTPVHPSWILGTMKVLICC